jgi:hypothetical protein
LCRISINASHFVIPVSSFIVLGEVGGIVDPENDPKDETIADPKDEEQ